MPTVALCLVASSAQAVISPPICLVLQAAAKLSARQKEALVNAGKDYDSKMAEILQERRHTAGMLHQVIHAFMLAQLLLTTAAWHTHTAQHHVPNPLSTCLIILVLLPFKLPPAVLRDFPGGLAECYDAADDRPWPP